eukprot:NODE_2133_length_670_cov_235.921095_g1799_i0.p1 GENE.NODE_2133_length_670_cov_235.921095_g1799_i0~~NODE_2133_length_670_cov_235.921095_g1799_i0.p1  ORF type:complete len:143 (-),score=24.50 NODE_2133_length_670_cov_235.921095_g1799_i0:178-606(-)
MRLFVLDKLGRRTELEVEGVETLQGLKSKLTSKLGIPAAQQRLLQNGREVLSWSDDTSLVELGLKAESEIDLDLAFRGGTSGCERCCWVILGIWFFPLSLFFFCCCQGCKDTWCCDYSNSGTAVQNNNTIVVNNAVSNQQVA